MASANWIKEATKNKGALTKTAKAEGAMTEKGTISKSWIKKKAKSTDTATKKRAILAMTLSKLRK